MIRKINETKSTTKRKTATRTEKQKEASRRNGGKSKGPKTQAGKKQSRKNAIKHGIFCRVVSHSYDAADTAELRDRLIEEFEPATQTGHVLVESLASDIIGLKRAREIHEFLMEPAKPYDEQLDIPGEEQVRQHELMCARIKGFHNVIDEFEGSGRLAMESDQATWFADLCWPMMEAQRRDLRAYRESRATDDSNDVDKHWEQVGDVFEQMDLARLKVKDAASLKSLLTGARRVTKANRERVLCLLDAMSELMIDMAMPAMLQKKERLRGEWEVRREQAARVYDIDKIMKYENHFSRRIERTLDRLASLQD